MSKSVVILTLIILSGCSGKSKTKPGKVVVNETQQNTTTVPQSTNNLTWKNMTIAEAPLGGDSSTTFWTGSKLITYSNFTGPNHNQTTGGIYDPISNSWSAMSLANAPTTNYIPSGVWTGSHLIIFGGYNNNSGGIYNPSSNTWSGLTSVGAPSPRAHSSIIWTGSKMFVFGGRENSASNYLNTSALYDPQTSTWEIMPTANAPQSRAFNSIHLAGSKILIFAGHDHLKSLNTGGIFNLETKTWSEMNSAFAPEPRAFHASVWTGSEMIVFGGGVWNPNNYTSGQDVIHSGGLYNLQSNSWLAMSNANAPSGRTNASSVWDGSRMIVFGGCDTINSATNTGGAYYPSANYWEALDTLNAPTARHWHFAYWTEASLIIFGGYFTNGNTTTVLNSGGIYAP